MAYYLKADPVGKIYDWRSYTGGTTIPTRLENILGIVVSQIGIAQPALTFYHFQYPNATHMLLIADWTGGPQDSFQVNLTSAYAYYEHSWALGCLGNGYCNYHLDGTHIQESYYCSTSQGLLVPSQLVLDAFHTVSFNGAAASAGLALIYRAP